MKPLIQRFDPKGGAVKRKAPSSNIQHPEKLQVPNTRLQGCFKPSKSKLAYEGPGWKLKSEASLDVGAWMFEVFRRHADAVPKR